MRLVGVIALVLLGAACTASIAPLPPARVPHPVRAEPAGGAGKRMDQTDQPVRVALATGRANASVSATGEWRLYDRTGEHQLARGAPGETWTITRDGAMLRARSDRGAVTVPFRGPLVARPTAPGSLVRYEGRAYRGELLVIALGGSLTVVNRLSVEEYLRGVVPLEIGVDRTPFERAAVEAQAIAARSYTYTRIDDSKPYDLSSTVTDQVYGGVAAERPVSDAAITATRNLVLLYHGRVINAPYHANSGGMTASASEVWRTRDAPYLVSVSDRIPGTDRFYDEASPVFRWTRTFGTAALQAALDRYLPRYAGAPRDGVGGVRAITVTGRTPSGRVAGVRFDTDRGSFTVRGNDVRFVLRTAAGALLPSTLFHIRVTRDARGRVALLAIDGNGSGHGVGMDQWGAIARARAGQDYVTILRTYYPGTTVGPIG